MPVNTRLQVRRGDYVQWTGVNPTLYDGEIGYEKDTGKFKIGDGVTAYTTLDYASVPLNSGNYISYSGINGSGVNIDFDALQGYATWSVDTDWLENFIANSSGAINAEVATRATVEEPCAVLNAAAIIKGRNIPR